MLLSGSCGDVVDGRVAAGELAEQRRLAEAADADETGRDGGPAAQREPGQAEAGGRRAGVAEAPGDRTEAPAVLVNPIPPVITFT